MVWFVPTPASPVKKLSTKATTQTCPKQTLMRKVTPVFCAEELLEPNLILMDTKLANIQRTAEGATRLLRAGVG